jgi:TusA-related sulfurtransferase
MRGGMDFAVQSPDGEGTMGKAGDRLNLVGVGWPICLMACQQRLSHLAPGQVVAVVVEDPEMAQAIRQLAQGQGDRIIGEHRQSRRLRLDIQKHADGAVKHDNTNASKRLKEAL